MRVLQCGMTTQHVGRDNRYRYANTSQAYADALRMAGLEVDHRQAVPGEDLTGYDACLVGLSAFTALGSRYLYGAMDVVSRARASGAALLFYLDDWQVQMVTQGAQTLVNGPWRATKEMMRTCRVDYEWGVEHLDEFMPAVQAVLERRWPTTLAPLYDGGDWSILTSKIPSDDVVGVDPTPFSTDYTSELELPRDSDRERGWTFGVLSDQVKWQQGVGFTWPVDKFGGRASKADKALKEPELMKEYARRWGVVSCPYWHAGSGWQRYRHEQAMQARCVLYTERDELSFVGPGFDVTRDQVEGADARRLREMADQQWMEWHARRPTRGQVSERAASAVRRAVEAMA